MSFPIPLVVLRQPNARVTGAELAAALGITKMSIGLAIRRGVFPPPHVRQHDRVCSRGPDGTQGVTLLRAYWRVRDVVACYFW